MAKILTNLQAEFSLSSQRMKKALLFGLLFVFGACASPDTVPSNNIGQFPPDYVVSLEGSPSPSVSGQPGSESPTPSGSVSPSADLTDVVACREQNTQLAMQVDDLQKRILTCQEDLSKANESTRTDPSATGVSESQVRLISNAITSAEQPQYPFKKCGQLQTFLQEGWFNGFSEALAAAKIKFSNGFLETSDLFGGCMSTEGKMVFFLGAERDSDIDFRILKYRTDTGILEPALMLDGAQTAIVTEFGSREGPFVNFPADDGRAFRYYYDANVVMKKP